MQEIFLKVIYVCNYSPPGNIIFMGQDGVAKPLPAYEVSHFWGFSATHVKTIVIQ
jgi:hypothetical protein